MATLSSAAHIIPEQSKSQRLALTVGALGVVFGDIGTSPLYAFREALAQTAAHGVGRPEILGVLSLALWALILIVTIKYVMFLMRADNEGEGGVLSLMALAQKAAQRRTLVLFTLGALGAALFYGDSVITPAISVLSAVEGLKTIPSISSHIDTPEILIISVGILTGLFLIQSKGTAKVAGFFGPVCILWFLVIALIGLMHVKDDWSVLAAINPVYGVKFVATHGFVGLLALGAVFLTVTGAEALTADMGHFGRKPIQTGWLFLVFPALLLNYFGQGALALSALEKARIGHHAFQNGDWFFLMAPGVLRAPLVVLATLATIIASQAVITGAFSLTQQAIQLGLLPRMDIRQTSGEQAGQIFIGRINGLLFVGVLFMALAFRNSSALAQAYGIAVTGTMVVTTCLAWLVARHVWKWRASLAALAIAPFLALDLTFFGANALRIVEGGWVPLMLAAALCLLMWTWVRGSKLLLKKVGRQSMAVCDLLDAINPASVFRAPGTAVFLSSDPDVAPVALMHNLKHNKVLHQQNVIVTVKSTTAPYVSEHDRLSITWPKPDLAKVVLNYGYMESPNVPKALLGGRSRGLKVDTLSTSYFLSRRTLVRSAHSELPMWQERLFTFLAKNATDPTTYFHIPAGRAVEMGAQVAL
jgi:KUP system potassium uptake protein